MLQPVGSLLDGALLPQEHLDQHLHHVAACCRHLLPVEKTHNQFPQWFSIDWIECNNYFCFQIMSISPKNETYLFIPGRGLHEAF